MNHVRRIKRRGSFLVELVFLIPVIAVLLTVIYQTSSRSMRVQGQSLRAMAADAARDDLVERIQRDAAGAQRAQLEQIGDAVVLTFEGVRSVAGFEEPDARADTQPATETLPEPQTIVYRVTGTRVARKLGSGDDSFGGYAWELTPPGVELRLEAIDAEPRMIWISFPAREAGQRSGLFRRLAAAAWIGRGGAR